MTNIYYLPRNDNDLEHMLESHYWIAAAYELGLDVRVHKHINEYEPAIFIGNGFKRNDFFKRAIYPDAKSINLSQVDLPRTISYRKWLNRNYAIVGYEQGVVGVIKAASKFSDKVFIKNQAQSKESFRFDCDAQDKEAIWEGIGYFLEYQSNDVLIYDYVEIKDETRFIVINQKVVSGSMIEAKIKPLNNKDCVKYYQCDDRLIDAAEQICKDFTNELPELTEYVLDLCFIDDKPSIVEVNSTRNYGLYGNHPINILPEIMKS
jgi:hypothetical protein